MRAACESVPRVRTFTDSWCDGFCLGLPQPAGIESGDVIESIDKRSANEMTLTELRTMLCKPNAKYSVGILRGSKHFQVGLSLRPLL